LSKDLHTLLVEGRKSFALPNRSATLMERFAPRDRSAPLAAYFEQIEVVGHAMDLPHDHAIVCCVSSRVRSRNARSRDAGGSRHRTRFGEPASYAGQDRGLLAGSCPSS